MLKKSNFNFQLLLMVVCFAMLFFCSNSYAQQSENLTDHILGPEAFLQAYNQKAAANALSIRLTGVGNIGGDAKGAAFSMKANRQSRHDLYIHTFGNDPHLSRIWTYIPVKNTRTVIDSIEWKNNIELMTIAICALGFSYYDSKKMVETIAIKALNTPSHDNETNIVSQKYEFQAKDENGKLRNYLLTADHTHLSDRIISLTAYQRKPGERPDAHIYLTLVAFKPN